jgi:hypothetical protein
MAEEYSIGGNHIKVQSTRTVEVHDLLVVMDNEESFELDIKIIADFDSIPPKYQEVFLNMITSRYFGKVSFGDNPFSQCLPPKKKKWYQFWISKNKQK